METNWKVRYGDGSTETFEAYSFAVSSARDYIRFYGGACEIYRDEEWWDTIR